MAGENNNLTLVGVGNLDILGDATLAQTAEVYQRAFAEPPYNELFTADQALGVLRTLLNREGDVVLGVSDNRVVSLAGGYPKDEGTYYIKELAVDPTVQGKGLGRLTLRGLMAVAHDQGYNLLELKTAADPSNRAARLYLSEGFTQEPTTELVTQLRQHGGIEADERIGMYHSLTGEDTRPPALKRVTVSRLGGIVTAVVNDQHIDAEPDVASASIVDAWERNRPEQPPIVACGFITFPEHTTHLAKLEVAQAEAMPVLFNAAWALSRGHNCSGFIELSYSDQPAHFQVREGQITLQIPVGDAVIRMSAAVEELHPQGHFPL